jgi:hypothetical protein
VTRLTGAAVFVFFEGFADAADGAGLVGAFDDGGINGSCCEGEAGGAALDEEIQFRLFKEACDGAGRVLSIVPKPVFVAVGVKDDGALSELFFEAIGVELRLLLADAGVAFGAFGFDDGEGFAVAAPEDVIDKAIFTTARRALSVGHAGDGEFAITGFVERPACFAEKEVNEGVAGFGFGIVVGIGAGFGGAADFGNFCAETLEFFIKGVAIGKDSGEFFVAFAETGFEGLELFEGLTREGRGARQQQRVEGQGGRGRRDARVSAGQPEGDVEEFANCGQGVGGLNGGVAVNGLITEAREDLRFEEDGLTGGVTEGGFVDEGAEVVLVGEAEGGVVFVGPGDGEFERAAGVEAGGAGVRVDEGEV